MSGAERPDLLVLLGNSGATYASTRHNAAWMLEPLLNAHEAEPWQRKFKAEWARLRISGHPVVVLKPQTMMNVSGESVQAASRFFRIASDRVAVAHDDVELAFGEIGVRFGGGLAGHNGLRSVAHCLGTHDFWRVRIGIGRPPRGEVHGHVLGRFTRDEEAELPAVLGAAASLIERGCSEGFGSLPARVSAVGSG